MRHLLKILNNFLSHSKLFIILKTLGLIMSFEKQLSVPPVKN